MRRNKRSFTLLHASSRKRLTRLVLRGTGIFNVHSWVDHHCGAARVAVAGFSGDVVLLFRFAGDAMVAGNERCAVLAAHAAPVVCTRGRGSFLASSSFDGSVRLWAADAAVAAATEAAEAAVEAGRACTQHVHTKCVAVLRDAQPLQGHEASIACVSLPAAAPSRLVRGGNDGLLKVWDLETQKPVSEFAGHRGWIWSLECPGDAGAPGGGDVFVTGSVDSDVRYWDVRAPPSSACTALLPLPGAGPVAGLAVRPGGRHLVTGSFEDHAVRLFDARVLSRGLLGGAATPLLGMLHAHSDRVTRLCVTDAAIASGSFDATVRLWRFDEL